MKFGKILKVSEHGKSRPLQLFIIWPVNHAQNARPDGLTWPGPEKNRPALQSHGFGAKTLKKEKERKKSRFFDELLVSSSDSKKLRKRFQCRNRRRLWVAMHQKNKTKQNKKNRKKNPKKNQQVRAAKKWVFDASQRVNKNRSSTFHDMMLLFHKYWDFFS